MVENLPAVERLSNRNCSGQHIYWVQGLFAATYLKMKPGTPPPGRRPGKSDLLFLTDIFSQVHQVFLVEPINREKRLVVPEDYKIAITCNPIAAVGHLPRRRGPDHTTRGYGDFHALARPVIFVAEMLDDISTHRPDELALGVNRKGILVWGGIRPCSVLGFWSCRGLGGLLLCNRMSSSLGRSTRLTSDRAVRGFSPCAHPGRSRRRDVSDTAGPGDEKSLSDFEGRPITQMIDSRQGILLDLIDPGNTVKGLPSLYRMIYTFRRGTGSGKKQQRNTSRENESATCLKYSSRHSQFTSQAGASCGREIPSGPGPKSDFRKGT